MEHLTLFTSNCTDPVQDLLEAAASLVQMPAPTRVPVAIDAMSSSRTTRELQDLRQRLLEYSAELRFLRLRLRDAHSRDRISTSTIAFIYPVVLAATEAADQLVTSLEQLISWRDAPHTSSPIGSQQ